MDIIKSRDNDILKLARKLKIKKYRRELGLYVIEGLRFIEDAVMSNAPVRFCMCSESLKGERAERLFKNLHDKSIRLYMLKDELFKDICDTKNPQGIIAIIERKNYTVESIRKDASFLILADRLQDPGNLGTIIRTADAANADGIIVSDGTVDPYSPKVLRSTMGSIFHIPVVAGDLIDAIKALKKQGFNVYASSLDGDNSYFDFDYCLKTAIVIGNEANGIDEEIFNLSDKFIKIPMLGRAESLNAAVAGGILMFEVVKQRMSAAFK
ncbi:MAG: RNA methyltransferase [Clostridiales bacterium]|nr:RNA methyltransferase [Clostridiales bacterium]